MRPGTALLLVKLLDLAIGLLAAYPLSQAKFKTMHAKLQAAVDEGREMTDAEMAEIFAEAEDLHNKIQDA